MGKNPAGSRSSRREAATNARTEWAARITGAWRKGIEAIFETGRLLIAAKAALPHGAWTRMVEAELPFSIRITQALMKIASDRRLQTPEMLPLLPAKWSTLLLLARLPDAELDHAVKFGAIHPKMERKEIEKGLSPSLFRLDARDVRKWRIRELRKAHAALSAIVEHCGGAQDDALVGDSISDKRLAEIFA